MNRWLFKQEPDCYSFAQLQADGGTVWDGVTNALALQHLRRCEVGDVGFYYHTGAEKKIVGIFEITGAPAPDPALDDEKFAVVSLKAVLELAQPVTLAQVKAEEIFAAWELVRNSRLSVMPCPEDFWNRVLELAGERAKKRKK